MEAFRASFTTSAAYDTLPFPTNLNQTYASYSKYPITATL